MLTDSPLPLRLALALLCAALWSFLLTPSASALAARLGAIDRPGEERRVHRGAVPRLGGMAIFLGVALALLCFSRGGAALEGVLRGALLIALMGALDDCLGLRAPLKLAAQLLAAGLAWRAGARIEVLTVPFAGSGRFVAVGALSLPLTLLWLTLCANAMNLIDGLDGLAAGVAAIASGSMLLVAALVSEGEVALLLAAVTGGCLGFLPYNRNPARVFMGDVGSQLLGYLLGAASLLGMFKAHALLGFLAPLALGLPLADTAWAFVRRALHGRNPLRADRGHIHHRLLDLGCSQREAVGLLYAVSALLGLLAVALAAHGALAKAIGAALFCASSAAALALVRRRLLIRAAARRG